MVTDLDEFSYFSNDDNVPSSSATNLSSITRNPNEKSCFSIIDDNISNDTEIEVILNMWVNTFKKNPRIGTINLFSVVLNCFNVDVCYNDFTNFDSDLMFSKIIQCFKTMEKIDVLISSETIKKSTDIQKTLQFVTLIFQRHGYLFFSNDTCKQYYIFLSNIIVKISQYNFIGPRLLATYLGLKIITGMLRSNKPELIRNDIEILLNEFLVKRWKDITCAVREVVLLELGLWIQIDAMYFLNQFWIYIYWALGDQSTTIQIVALKISKNILNMHLDNPNVNLLIKKIIAVLSNFLLSTNEEVVISAFNLYSVLPSIEDEQDEEKYMSFIESISLELIFSEKTKVAKFAANNFVNQFVNTQPNASEQLKVILITLRGIPQHMISIVASFYVEAIYDLCPVLIDFELISLILTLDNFIEKKDKFNLMILLMYVVQWLVTGIKPDHKVTNNRDQNDIIQLNINTFKKKEFTTYLLIHLLNQLKECEEPTHAFSLWILLQFIDFKLLQDKMILPVIMKHVFSFYHTWNTPTILEMISKCINIISMNVEEYEQELCFNCVKDISQFNINILINGVENLKSAPSLLDQNNALIKIWTLAKYNHIPVELKSLKYLSYYVPNLNDDHSSLIVSKYALNAYMEILRNELLKVPSNIQHTYDNSEDNIYFNFLEAMFDILSKYDPQVLDICETAFININDLLRIKYIKDGSNYVLDDNQNKKLTDFMFCICRNCEHNDDLNTIKLVELYVQLILDGLIEISHLITILQFIKMKLFEIVLRPIFNFFCKKETGDQLSDVINIYLVYMFENIISQKPDFKNFTIKDMIDIATIITRLLKQCTDQIGKRLISTNIQRHGIQYAMNDTLNNPYIDYPFKQYFWVLASLCDTLIPYDAQRLANYFINKPAIQELISVENDHVLRYLYKLQEIGNIKAN